APVNTSLEPYRFLDRLFHEAGQNWGALQAILYTLRHQFTDPEAIKKIQNLEVSITKGLERPHREVKRAWTLSVEGSRGDETSLKKLANDKEGLQDLVEQCRIIEHSFAGVIRELETLQGQIAEAQRTQTITLARYVVTRYWAAKVYLSDQIDQEMADVDLRKVMPGLDWHVGGVPSGVQTTVS